MNGIDTKFHFKREYINLYAFQDEIINKNNLIRNNFIPFYVLTELTAGTLVEIKEINLKNKSFRTTEIIKSFFIVIENNIKFKNYRTNNFVHSNLVRVALSYEF